MNIQMQVQDILVGNYLFNPLTCMLDFGLPLIVTGECSKRLPIEGEGEMGAWRVEELIIIMENYVIILN